MSLVDRPKPCVNAVAVQLSSQIHFNDDCEITSEVSITNLIWIQSPSSRNFNMDWRVSPSLFLKYTFEWALYQCQPINITEVIVAGGKITHEQRVARIQSHIIHSIWGNFTFGMDAEKI